MFVRLKQLFSIKGYSLFVICMILVGIGISITMPYLSLYCTEELDMNAGTFGVFMAVSSITGVIANSFIAKKSDNGLDRKAIILIAMFSSSLGYASYLLFENFFALLILISFFNGLGAAAMPQIFAYSQESANESQSDDKIFAMSTLRSLFSLGFLIGPLIGTLLLTSSGYKGLFWSTSGIFLFISGLVFFFLQSRKTKSHPVPPTQQTSSNNKALRKPFAAFVLLLAVNSINGIITPLFIIHNLHGTHAEVGFVVSLCAGLEIPIMLILGALGRRISNRTLLIYGCLIAVLYFSVLLISTAPWQILVAQLLQAIFVAIVMGNGLSYFNELLPHSPGVSSTMYSNASTIGRLLGTMGGGIIAEFTGYRHVYWVCVALVFLSFIILVKIKPTATEKTKP